MIDCPNGDVRDMLPDYLHDRLEPSARGVVEQHLAGCSACREELALLRELRGTLQRAPRVDVAAIAASIPPHPAPARQGRAVGWRAAAAIAAIAIGGTSIALWQRSTHPSPAAGASSAAIAVAPTPAVAGREPVIASRPAERTATATAPESPSRSSTRAPDAGELAMGGGAITDLSDGELSALLRDIESLDALPSTDVEATEPGLAIGQGGGR
jgi:anti-sigma factor RsiW